MLFDLHLSNCQEQIASQISPHPLFPLLSYQYLNNCESGIWGTQAATRLCSPNRDVFTGCVKPGLIDPSVCRGGRSLAISSKWSVNGKTHTHRLKLHHSGRSHISSNTKCVCVCVLFIHSSLLWLKEGLKLLPSIFWDSYNDFLWSFLSFTVLLSLCHARHSFFCTFLGSEWRSSRTYNTWDIPTFKSSSTSWYRDSIKTGIPAEIACS